MGGNPSCFLSAPVRPPQPCRLLPFVTIPLALSLLPVLGGKGEPSPWMGCNPKEQFSLPLSRGKEGSSSTGSPPPPSPPLPPSQQPIPYQALFVHRPALNSVDRFAMP